MVHRLTLCTSFSSYDSTALCSQIWSITAIAGGWRITPFYVAIAVALLIWPFNLWLSYVAGCQLIILAILRLFTICRYGAGKGEGLLPQYDDGFDKQVIGRLLIDFRAGSNAVRGFLSGTRASLRSSMTSCRGCMASRTKSQSTTFDTKRPRFFISSLILIYSQLVKGFL